MKQLYTCYELHDFFFIQCLKHTYACTHMHTHTFTHVLLTYIHKYVPKIYILWYISKICIIFWKLHNIFDQVETILHCVMFIEGAWLPSVPNYSVMLSPWPCPICVMLHALCKYRVANLHEVFLSINNSFSNSIFSSEAGEDGGSSASALPRRHPWCGETCAAHVLPVCCPLPALTARKWVNQLHHG